MSGLAFIIGCWILGYYVYIAFKHAFKKEALTK